MFLFGFLFSGVISLSYLCNNLIHAFYSKSSIYSSSLRSAIHNHDNTSDDYDEKVHVLFAVATQHSCCSTTVKEYGRQPLLSPSSSSSLSSSPPGIIWQDDEKIIDPTVDNYRRHNNNRRRQFLRSITGSTIGSLSSVVLLAFTPIVNTVAYAQTEKVTRKQLITPQQILVEARDRIDLAVQASSVQAWTDATEIANDDSLNIEVLTKSFDQVIADIIILDITTDGTPNANNAVASNDDSVVVEKAATIAVRLNEYRDKCIAGVVGLRDALSKPKPLTTETAIDVMRVGTNSRVAMDSFLQILDEVTKIE